ncbi:DNA topoisomerase IB [uncultured Psychroserpens sp.]|uniref:DNA topoisomerase IB n=1 Tax=uncultured Psychroserpens sp. TaxID=255436 RepID=UPI00263638E0|nr:DNA topoisomerase IB [uncultured Psychroserpens sp.]
MSKQPLLPKLLEQIDEHPEHAIETLDLTYINPKQLAIHRHRKGKIFQYTYKGKLYRDREDLKRIESLVIPPAWEHVKISTLANGHLQATGRDLKSRKQYRYHQKWNKIKNQTKFFKMAKFGEALPLIRDQVEKDIIQPNWTKSKVLALVIKLMEETHIRIGNRYYAKKNKTYGLTTLRSKHVHLFKDRLRFEFTGKKGKEHSITLRNKKLVHLVNKCEELPGWELFQFYDKSGEKHHIDSSMVNDYLQNITKASFTAKDFRTWSASVIFMEALMDFDRPTSEKEIDKNILTAYDITSSELGNTRNVCRKYYVHPILEQSYKDDTLHDVFTEIETSPEISGYLTPTEMSVLKLIRNYRPII